MYRLDLDLEKMNTKANGVRTHWKIYVLQIRNLFPSCFYYFSTIVVIIYPFKLIYIFLFSVSCISLVFIFPCSFSLWLLVCYFLPFDSFNSVYVCLQATIVLFGPLWLRYSYSPCAALLSVLFLNVHFTYDHSWIHCVLMIHDHIASLHVPARITNALASDGN
jgi:hypothetical protein